MARAFRAVWRGLFDVRKGEFARTACMTLYLLFVLFAYYILKPVSRAMFVHKFDIDLLPWLYILIALVGGLFAYGYTKITVRASLAFAVNVATALVIAALIVIWWLLRLRLDWMLYVFNVFVSLFSIILVSQGWLVAANIFNPREAKRLYGILGLGAVLGAAFGGSFTAWTVEAVGVENLVPASAFLVLLAYFCYRLLIAQKGVSLSGARAGEEPEEFSLAEVGRSVARHRHLQVIIAIISITYVVDVMVEFQFSAMAKAAYLDREDLTAFFGSFYGLWLNLCTFFFQAFLTSAVVGRFGVGGALQVMPVTIAVASATAFAAPSVWSTGATRLAEASTRYTFNRTGMELLYLPLPVELKNRTKAFMDIFVDRMSRGLGGLILVLLTGVIDMPVRYIALVVAGLSALWIGLSERARREYVSTVRRRVESRRLDLEQARVSVSDPATIRLLEQTTHSDNPRQVGYALHLLAQIRGYDLEPHLVRLAESRASEVRAQAFELALQAGTPRLLERALAAIRTARAGDTSPCIAPAVRYVTGIGPESQDLTRRLLDHPCWLVASSALEALADQPQQAAQVIGRDWLAAAAGSPHPDRRALAAIGLRAMGGAGGDLLLPLIKDGDPRVVAPAVRTAAASGERIFVEPIVRRLGEARVRGVAIEALKAFGARIVGTLNDLLADDSLSVAVRRHIPRVLYAIGGQHAADVLFQHIAEHDLTVRGSVLKALNRLREEHPELSYGPEPVTRQILEEARHYYELHAALAPLRELKAEKTPVGLLASTIEERLWKTIDRLFHLLGIRYSPREMQAVYSAVLRKKGEEYIHALEFLDNVLDRDLKRVMLPLIDAGDQVVRAGHELFGVETKDAERAIRELIWAGDSWLVSCAMAAAAQLKLVGLRPEISEAARDAGAEVSLVARSALAALA